jgi:hypothetical protein
MLGNFFLMLTKRGSKQLQLQKHYQRIVKLQKEMIYKKTKKEIIRRGKIIKYFWRVMKKLIQWGMKFSSNKRRRREEESQFWIKWINEME